MNLKNANAVPIRRSLPSPVGAVVFDMDGLLLDTEPLYRAAFLETALGFGFPVSDQFYSELIGISTRERRTMMRAELGPDFPDSAFFDEYARRKRASTAHGIPLKPGAVGLLRELRERRLPIALVTSASAYTAHSHLRRCGMLEDFRAVVTRDDVEHGKPHPEPFLKAARGIGILPSRCLALEDSHCGTEAAYRSGMMVVMVPDLLEPSDAISQKCAMVAASLHEVKELLTLV
jgi:HAD superfamily hydrolase (TIGR01509 family)